MTIFVPWLANAAPAPYAGSEARYHRLVVTHTHNDDAYFQLAELTMFDDWAGSPLTVGVAIGTPTLGLISYLSDNQPSTDSKYAMPSAVVGYDHSASQLLVEFSLTASAAHAGDADETGAMPSEMELQESSNGTDWTTVATYTDIPPWFRGEVRFFPVADTSLATSFAGKWRHQRMRGITTVGGTLFGGADLGFYDNIGDVAQSSGTFTHPVISVGGEASAFDGNFFTLCQVLMSDLTTRPSGGWMGLFYGTTPADQIAEVSLSAYAVNTTGMPTEFVVEGSNWSGLYTEITRHSGIVWVRFTTQRFTV